MTRGTKLINDRVCTSLNYLKSYTTVRMHMEKNSMNALLEAIEMRARANRARVAIGIRIRLQKCSRVPGSPELGMPGRPGGDKRNLERSAQNSR